MLRYDIIIPILWSLMTSSFAFTVDRAVVFVPPAWDTAPSLDTYQRVLVDPAMKSKTGMNRILQTEDAKMSENMLENQSEKKSTTDNIDTDREMKPINEIASARNDASDFSEENANAIITARNIILLLIDERGQDEKKENSWKDYKERLPFAIEGFLENCHNKTERANFSMNNASIFEKKKESCDCEHVLLSNIEELLSWARHVRGMTTGVISSSNFSIPFFPRYESSGSNKSNAKLELRKSKRDSSDGWQVIDLNNQTSSVSPLITKADSKTERDMNYDTTWDIFDIFSKIRMAFFRSLLESLQKNDDVFKDELSLRKPFFLQSTINLIEKTIRELKSIPNDKGYILIAVVPRNEGVTAIDLLQHEASLKDTFFIVTRICVRNQKFVPFAAQGPNNRIFREARTIDELPVIIKKAMITNDCHDIECTNRQRRDVPIDSRVSTGEIVSQEMQAAKRIVRNKNVEKPETDKLNATTSNTVSTEETTIGKEIQIRNLALLKTIPCGLATVLGAMTSIFSKAAITS